MKNRLTHIIKLVVISGIVSLLSTICIYKFLPQYLCYGIYNASENDLYEKEDVLVQSGTQFVEVFIPTADYMKNIVFYAKAKADKDSPYEYVTGKLMNDSGELIKVSICELQMSESGAYGKFEIEEWVKPGTQYQFAIDFSGCQDLYLLFGPADSGPEEHVKLIEGNEEVGENMFLR